MFSCHILHFAIDGMSVNTPYQCFYILETQDSAFYSICPGSVVKPPCEQKDVAVNEPRTAGIASEHSTLSPLCEAFWVVMVNWLNYNKSGPNFNLTSLKAVLVKLNRLSYRQLGCNCCSSEICCFHLILKIMCSS